LVPAEKSNNGFSSNQALARTYHDAIDAFAVLLSAAVPFATLAQTADDLRNDENTPGDVLVYGMGCSAL